MIVKLTQDFIANNLRCPEGKRRIEYVDEGGTGLYCECREMSPGQGTYYMRWKRNGKTCHEKLGRTTDISLEKARARVETLKAEQLLGIDRWADEKAKRSVPLFSDYMINSFLPHARTHLRTADKYEEYYRLRLQPVFGHQRLNQIKRHEIQLFHSKLREEGLAPATCNLYLRTLKTAFSRAIQWEIMEGPNPAVGIKQYRERQIENYLDEKQLHRLLKVLQTDKNRIVCDIILFLLSTGARLNEALTAKWEYIDVEHRVWRIAATNSKSGKVRAVPLNDSGLAALLRQPTRDKSEYVFVNKRTGKHYVTIQRVWSRLRREADIENFRCHDLRHSAASYMAQAGISLYIIQGVLGHSSPVVTQRYAHLSTKTLQDASDKVADVISNAMK